MRFAALVVLLQLAFRLAAQDGANLAATYQTEVERRLDLPLAEQRLYAEQASKLLEAHNIPDPQYVVLVDRNKYVQALMVYWMAPDRKLSLHRGLTCFHRQTGPLRLLHHAAGSLPALHLKPGLPRRRDEERKRYSGLWSQRNAGVRFRLANGREGVG